MLPTVDQTPPILARHVHLIKLHRLSAWLPSSWDRVKWPIHTYEWMRRERGREREMCIEPHDTLRPTENTKNIGGGL